MGETGGWSDLTSGRIERAVRDFEQEWRGGGRPRIEPARDRVRLLNCRSPEFNVKLSGRLPSRAPRLSSGRLPNITTMHEKMRPEPKKPPNLHKRSASSSCPVIGADNRNRSAETADKPSAWASIRPPSTCVIPSPCAGCAPACGRATPCGVPASMPPWRWRWRTRGTSRCNRWRATR